jgi:AcrR family transcriptional regulator
MEKSLIKRHESIIVSTIQTLNEVGLQNLSTKLIAKQEGVSEGTLFRHFKTKTEIMLAVVDHFSQYDNAIIETCSQKNFSPLEAIRYFYNAYAEYYQNYPEITAVVQAYDSLMCDVELTEKVSSIIYKRSEFIIRMIQAAIDQKHVRTNIDPTMLENILTGGSKEICLKWRIEKYSFSIKEKTAAMVELILNSCMKN